MGLSSLMTHKIIVERPLTTQDASAGRQDTFSPLAGASDVPASIQPLSPQERAFFAQRQVVFSHRIFVCRELHVERSDRITDNKGRTFIVEGNDDEAGRGVLYCIRGREYQV